MTANGATNSTAKPQSGLDLIALDVNRLCKVSGWHNNCGLNCLTHFLFDKLSSMPVGEFDLFLAANPEYIAILDTFKEYYNLQNNYGWQDILGLLRAHPVPTDREALLAPVFRKHLGKLLIGHVNELWDTKAAAAFGDCIAIDTPVGAPIYQDISMPLYYSNRAFYDNLRQEFQTELMRALESHPTELELQVAAQGLRDNSNNKKIPNYTPTNDAILRHVIFQRKNLLQERFFERAQMNWMTEGCKRYADYVANINNMVMISADQLQFLCESLNVGVEVFTFDSMRHATTNRETGEHTHGAQWVSERPFQWKMKVMNMGGVHWIFQEPNRNEQKRVQHNKHYETPLSDELAGKFKIITSRPVSKELIIAEVKHMLGEMTAEELTQIKTIAAIAEAVAEARRQEMAKKAQEEMAKTAASASLLVFSVFDATSDGKALYALLVAHKEALALVNQHFDVAMARKFMQQYSGCVAKLQAANGPTLVAFLDKFIKQNKPALPLPATGHALSDALNMPLVPAILVARDTKPSIKLSHLTIMQQNDVAKRMTVLIERNRLAMDAFNQYSEDKVRRLAGLINPALLEAYEKLNQAEQVAFIEKFGKQTPAPAAVAKKAL